MRTHQHRVKECFHSPNKECFHSPNRVLAAPPAELRMACSRPGCLSFRPPSHAAAAAVPLPSGSAHSRPALLRRVGGGAPAPTTLAPRAGCCSHQCSAVAPVVAVPAAAATAMLAPAPPADALRCWPTEVAIGGRPIAAASRTPLCAPGGCWEGGTRGGPPAASTAAPAAAAVAVVAAAVAAEAGSGGLAASLPACCIENSCLGCTGDG